jgi:hypothetical protein
MFTGVSVINVPCDLLIEQIIGFIWILIGVICNSYIISNITTIMTSTDRSKEKY